MFWNPSDKTLKKGKASAQDRKPFYITQASFSMITKDFSGCCTA